MEQLLGVMMNTSHTTILPEVWVQKIFATMTANYGSRFMNQWKLGETLPDGRDVGLVAAQQVWAEKLGCYLEHPEAIKAVLDCLPAHPPTLPEFYALCVQHRVTPKYAALPKPKVSQEQGKIQLEKIKAMMGTKLFTGEKNEKS